MQGFVTRLSRRSLLLSGSAVLAAMPLRRLYAASGATNISLTAAHARVALAGEPHPETDMWTYNGQVPGPEIRLRQGERLRVEIKNRLKQDTTIHWHGVRVPNAMDGAPDVTQPSIEPGASFVYEFTVPDSGTYWYHPHAHSAEQMGRGLAGALIIDEPDPIPVDRDVTWMLGDWRLKRDASIAADFYSRMEMGMAGRVGNTVTINGHVPDMFPARSGERIRLRLINAAPARIFGLEFREHRPLVITLDGQSIDPHAPVGNRIVLGPAMRADLIIDMTGRPGSRAQIVDSFYEDLSYRLVDIAYTDEPPLRTKPLEPPPRLAANTMPEPDLARAQRHDVTFSGGMMGGMGTAGGMSGGMGGGGMSGMMKGGAMWAINGVAAEAHSMKPMLTLARGSSYILALNNETAWYHPIHLHGHSFRVITRNGQPTQYREWCDTVLVPPRERAEIAFVADNPGDWMFHCHILEHQDGGMMSIIRVT